MYGPPSQVKKLYEAIPDSALFDAENGFYSFPCSSVPSVSFSWGGENWDISADKLVNIFLIKSNLCFSYVFSVSTLDRLKMAPRSASVPLLLKTLGLDPTYGSLEIGVYITWSDVPVRFF